MNSDALMLFLILAGSLLAITLFFFVCQRVLGWLEMPDPPQALAGFVGPAGPGLAPARAADETAALDRFADDGGSEVLERWVRRELYPTNKKAQAINAAEPRIAAR
jgi:hypothetical protein